MSAFDMLFRLASAVGAVWMLVWGVRFTYRLLRFGTVHPGLRHNYLLQATGTLLLYLISAVSGLNAVFYHPGFALLVIPLFYGMVYAFRACERPAE